MSSPIINTPTPPPMSHVTSANGSQDFSQTKLQALSCGAHSAIECAALLNYVESKVSSGSTPSVSHSGKPAINKQANLAPRAMALQGLHVAGANPQTLSELMALSPFSRDGNAAPKASETSTIHTQKTALENEHEYYLALRDARSQLVTGIRQALRDLQAARAKKNALEKKRMRRSMQMRKAQQQQARGSAAATAKVAAAATTTNKTEAYRNDVCFSEKRAVDCGYKGSMLECSVETEAGLESDSGHVFSKDKGIDDGGWRVPRSSPTTLAVENSSEMESSEEDVTVVAHADETVTGARKLECAI